MGRWIRKHSSHKFRLLIPLKLGYKRIQTNWSIGRRILNPIWSCRRKSKIGLQMALENWLHMRKTVNATASVICILPKRAWVCKSSPLSSPQAPPPPHLGQSRAAARSNVQWMAMWPLICSRTSSWLSHISMNSCHESCSASHSANNSQRAPSFITMPSSFDQAHSQTWQL